MITSNDWISRREAFTPGAMSFGFRVHSNLYLLTEFWPYAIEKSGHSPKKFIDQLTKLGFEISIIKNNKIIPLENDPLIENYETDEFYTLICKKSQL